ncbi:hypothetical protein BaRGS_00020961 [Batillaria attramentaria]|uniref:Uncharacterized protein n=1 Tax=Batillaria attramentaria TaxID=370345 RepID=A0ABD0KLF8_9CAEN
MFVSLHRYTCCHYTGSDANEMLLLMIRCGFILGCRASTQVELIIPYSVHYCKVLFSQIPLQEKCKGLPHLTKSAVSGKVEPAAQVNATQDDRHDRCQVNYMSVSVSRLLHAQLA